VDGVAQPASIAQLARAVTAQGELGTDWALPGALLIDGAIAGARAPLTQEEIARYRALGADVGREIGALCRRLEPGVTEETIARCAADAVAAVGARAIVALVGADDRIARFRHPTPTGVPWRRLFMLVVCAERHGLVAAVTRLVSAGPVDPDIARRTSAAVSVLERLLEGTRPGVTGRDLYAVATSAYANLGFPGEETRHHQGGAIGYQAREWLAHPASEMRVESRQAFAWNPSITGTKVEDTALLVDDEMEMITGSPGWPSAEMRVGGRMLAAPLVLERT
jgi:antitoxin VapB